MYKRVMSTVSRLVRINQVVRCKVISVTIRYHASYYTIVTYLIMPLFIESLI